MKLNIPQMVPARAVFSVRLHVRSEDLPAYQAATLSHRTFVDATVDLGPEDFPSDPLRLAARDLEALLRSEHTGNSNHYYDDDGKPIVAGMLVITVAYPFDESEIRQTVIKLVGDALNQGEFVTSAFEAFEVWTRQVESTFRSTAKALLRKHKKNLSQFANLQSRREVAIQQLAHEELLSIVNDYRDLARAIPSEADVQSALASSISSESLPFPTQSLRVTLHSKHLMAGFSMDRSPIARTSSPEPAVYIDIYVIENDDRRGREATLDCQITIKGSLIGRAKNSIKIAFTDLDPLMDAVYQVQNDWGKYDSTFDEDRVPADISEALKRVEAKAIADEVTAWINSHGSPSLKLGHEQKFSMTRQYRLERAQSVLADLLAPYPGWALVLSGDLAHYMRSAEKASPSSRALNILVGIKTFAPNATIHYSATLNEETAPEDGEYLWIPDGQCFPDAPGIAVCWPLPVPAKKAQKRR
jgi:hypothetical protein